MSPTPDQYSALTPPDLPRRTILQGAAWTIPAIAVATVAPTASASTTAVLTFNQAAYSGTACGTITGASVTVTVGGIPTAGRSVTTTLSDGYTFAGGSTTNTQVSDTNGRVNLPTIRVPAGGGSATASASSASAAVATASVTSPVTGSLQRFIYNTANNTRQNNSFTQIPAGTTPIGADGYLSSTGDLYFDNNATPIATGVSKATGYTFQNTYILEYVLSADGSLHRFIYNTANNTRQNYSFTQIPAGTTPIGADGYLSSTGDLYFDNNATPIATGVSKATGYTFQGFYTLEYVLSADGSLHRFIYNTANNTRQNYSFTQIPAGTTPIGADGYLSSTGDLYFDNNATPIATGVSKATGYTFQGLYTLEYVLSADGSLHRFIYNTANNTRQNYSFTQIPAGTTPIGADGYLSSTGDLYFDNNATPIATGVSKATGYTFQGLYTLEYVQPAACA